MFSPLHLILSSQFYSSRHGALDNLYNARPSRVAGFAPALLPMHGYITTCKQPVSVLQRKPARLRVEEVDQGYEKGIEDAKVYVGAPTDAVDAVDADRSHLYYEECEDPI